MKLFLIKFVVLFLLAFNWPSELLTKELKAVYKVELGSFNIGNLKWIIKLEDDNYTMSIFLKDKGFISGLYKFTGEYHSEGKIFKNEFISSKYKQSWKTKKKTRVIEIIFDKTMVSVLTMSPKEEGVPRIKYLKVSGLTDPLSSFLNILIKNTTNLKTIDGRRLYKMSIDFEKNNGNFVSKKIIITDYINIWTDHKRNDLKFISTIQDLSKKDEFLPSIIKIKNKGLIFKLTRI